MYAHFSASVAVGALGTPLKAGFPMTAAHVAEPSPHYQTRFVEARPQQCRFIVTDATDEAVCCGAPTSETSSWCQWHQQVVFQPSRSERDQRKAA